MAALCHIVYSLLNYTTFLSICNTDSKLMNCFLLGPPLTFLQIEGSGLSLEPFKDWRKFFKIINEEDRGRCSACFCFLISFRRSLRNEQALMGEISHHLGSMGGLPPAWSAESGF